MTTSSTATTTPREVWIDWLRVAACFMVMVVHSTEPFYIGGEGASYGMYLCHMFVLAAVSAYLRESLGTGADGSLGFWTTPLQIILTAICTFAVTAVACTLIQRIPRVGKWVMG